MKVDDTERFEGETNPAFTSSLESAVDTSGVKVEYSCVADESSPAGEYQIEATVTDPNFDVTVEPGTLTVKKKQEPVDPDPVVPDPDKPDGPDPDKPGTPDSDQSDSGDPAKPGSSADSAADKARGDGAENPGQKASSKSGAQQLADTGDHAPLAVAVAAGAVALIAIALELLRRRRSDA